eukprot:Unigene21510_Nuclearia_a/m.57515 Unigene21510_Nuclearia_a/g.57515  ORF Unigene21510_Nuclearia_a/g.57515 Unigene21510_Nuclearia_a/m.57515 type:complete len:149 (+) Unigene21510_Nuclearia_a:3-449(+)
MDKCSYVSVLDPATLRVSSVLGRNARAHGRQCLVDGDDETCWRSEQGRPQWVAGALRPGARVDAVVAAFQGGFAARTAELWAAPAPDAALMLHATLHPADSNGEQVLRVAPPLTGAAAFRLVLDSSDLFGRVVCYKFDVVTLTDMLVQ